MLRIGCWHLSCVKLALAVFATSPYYLTTNHLSNAMHAPHPIIRKASNTHFIPVHLNQTPVSLIDMPPWAQCLGEVPLDIHTTHVSELSSPSFIGKIKNSSKRSTLNEPIDSFDLQDVPQPRGFHRPIGMDGIIYKPFFLFLRASAAVCPSLIGQIPFWTQICNSLPRPLYRLSSQMFYVLCV